MSNNQFSNKTQNYRKGRGGEGEARKCLENKGFKFVEANYRNNLGEIDLVMTDGDWLVFVEVKYKADDRLGLPEEMIDKRKLAQVKRVANWYLMEKSGIRKKYEKYRIDAVCILGNEIRHYENVC